MTTLSGMAAACHQMHVQQPRLKRLVRFKVILTVPRISAYGSCMSFSDCMNTTMILSASAKLGEYSTRDGSNMSHQAYH